MFFFFVIPNDDITNLLANLCGGVCNHQLLNNVSNCIEQLAILINLKWKKHKAVVHSNLLLS